MQTFKKCYSQLFLIAFLLISSLYFTACDTSENDVIINDKPIYDSLNNVITVSTGSSLRLFFIDIGVLFNITTPSEFELTSSPLYGTAELNGGLITYRSYYPNNPSPTDEFTYKLDGKKGIIRLAYRPDSMICEPRADYFYTTRNNRIYNVDFLQNDITCNTLGWEKWAIEREDYQNSGKRLDFILHKRGEVRLEYFPPKDFIGIQQCTYTVVGFDGKSKISSITIEVGENTDSTCISIIKPDTFTASNLSTYQSLYGKLILLNESEEFANSYVSEFDIDSFYYAPPNQEYYYIPYLDNDEICSYYIFDWKLKNVDWNGVQGGIHGIGYYPYSKNSFFVPINTPKPFSFFYTLKNQITGEEKTAKITVN